MSKSITKVLKDWTPLMISKLRKQILNNTSISLMSYYLGMPQDSIREMAGKENLSLSRIDEMEISK